MYNQKSNSRLFLGVSEFHPFDLEYKEYHAAFAPAFLCLYLPYNLINSHLYCIQVTRSAGKASV